MFSFYLFFLKKKNFTSNKCPMIKNPFLHYLMIHSKTSVYIWCYYDSTFSLMSTNGLVYVWRSHYDNNGVKRKIFIQSMKIWNYNFSFPFCFPFFFPPKHSLRKERMQNLKVEKLLKLGEVVKFFKNFSFCQKKRTLQTMWEKKNENKRKVKKQALSINDRARDFCCLKV